MAPKASSSKTAKSSSIKEEGSSKVAPKKKSEVKTDVKTATRQKTMKSSSVSLKKEKKEKGVVDEKNAIGKKAPPIKLAVQTDSEESLQPTEPVQHLSLIEEKSSEPSQPATSKGRALPRIGAKKKESAPLSESVPMEVPEKIEIRAEEPLLQEQKIIHIKPPIMIKDLAAQMNVKPFKMIHDLMEMNIFANINQSVEVDIAAKLCERYGFVFEREKRTAGAGIHKVEPTVVLPPPPPKEKEEKPEKKITRAPIITFMGHVDHGKTSLLDAIRRAKVASGEAGGITQHIGAYSIERNGKPITFIDTPGHAAFTAMRARGANITDIVVLVVAANDGLMPQTLEALSHAKAAKVTIMVAINKMDLPAANADRVKGQLQEQGLTPEDWGGETICCEVSATTGTGIEHLLEMMLLQAEMLELTANPELKARGSVIEAQVEAGRGPTATIIIQSGTLSVGDVFVCGNYWGKVKQLIDDLGKPIKKAGPSTPVKVLGFSGLPNAGDELIVMEERSARHLSEERLQQLRGAKLVAPQRATLENLFKNTRSDQKKILQIILKSDVQGSLEAITGALADIPQKKIELKVIHAAVGPISESDVLLASASNAIIIGFGTKVENSAAVAARREGIQIKLYSIIYELMDQLREAMEGLLEPELREAIIGHATVKQIFDLTRGMVAGSTVTDGRILRAARARVLRGRQAIYDGGVATLRRFTEDVKEVRAGLECGIRLGDFTEYEPGDVIECYTLEKVAQTL